MQLASHGARGIPRVSHISSGGPSLASRSIHIPAYARVPKPSAPPNVPAAKRVLLKTRTFLTRIVGHLSTPGLQQAHHASTLAQSVRSANPGGKMSTIQQRMSYPVRQALSRPVQPLFFPRGPAVANRSVSQVGLGTARNFHSGRPLFQNFIDNVPIAGRAFYEADWELHSKQDRQVMRKILTKSTKENYKGKERMKPRAPLPSYPSSVCEEAFEPTSADLDQYFPAPTPKVNTYLLIPLAPTPTHRVPLDPNGGSLLPRSSLLSMHNEHEMHGLRVSSLFSRLDAAKVWDHGAVCSSYASHADKDGVCTILRVEFVGWTAVQVRSVIGEAGTGWCALEEERTSGIVEEDDPDDTLSDTSSILSGISDPLESPPSIFFSEAVSESFVLPRLDLSSSLLDSDSGSGSPRLSRRTSASDFFYDVEYEDPWTDVEVSEPESLDDVSSYGRLRLSYEFANRSQYGPREELF